MLKIVRHPLIEIKLTEIRNSNADHWLFRNNLKEIAQLMVYEILKEYPIKPIKTTTATGAIMLGSAFDKEIVFVPILRAGLVMADGLASLVPQARIGHIGLYRDEDTKEAVEYFYKMPNVPKDSCVIVVDPMLATGASAYKTLSMLKREGYSNINLVSLVGCDEGIKKIEDAFPDISIFLATKDPYLNKNKFIIPGLGDAGDRIFGTK